MVTAPAEPRPTCYRCSRPQVACVCAMVTPVDNRTEVIILQHPRERSHPFGTVRIARLGLKNLRHEIHYHPRAAPSSLGDALGGDVALLYPRPDAVPLSGLSPAERPGGLLVLDGTWGQAGSLYRSNPWLQALPHVSLRPERPSNYRIRKEPAAHCLSTIEAIVSALQILEPQTQGLDGLLESFGRIVDRQIDLSSERYVPRRRELRPRRPRRIPRSLMTDPEHLVVVYCETTGRPARVGRERQLLYWTAHRLGTGETLTAHVRPRGLRVDTRHADHMGLASDDFERGLSRAELLERWRAFRRPDDVVTAWNQSTLDQLRTFDPDARTALLKATYCNLIGGPCGHLEEIVAQVPDRGPRLDVDGRARVRLESAVALARLIRAWPEPGS